MIAVGIDISASKFDVAIGEKSLNILFLNNPTIVSRIFKNY